jgi:hypothetical protein
LGLAVRRSLPVYPDDRTSSMPIGMSQRPQVRCPKWVQTEKNSVRAHVFALPWNSDILDSCCDPDGFLLHRSREFALAPMFFLP